MRILGSRSRGTGRSRLPDGGEGLWRPGPARASDARSSKQGTAGARMRPRRSFRRSPGRACLPRMWSQPPCRDRAVIQLKYLAPARGRRCPPHTGRAKRRRSPSSAARACRRATRRGSQLSARHGRPGTPRGDAARLRKHSSIVPRRGCRYTSRRCHGGPVPPADPTSDRCLRSTLTGQEAATPPPTAGRGRPAPAIARPITDRRRSPGSREPR
jgi:hypothetical protein